MDVSVKMAPLGGTASCERGGADAQADPEMSSTDLGQDDFDIWDWLNETSAPAVDAVADGEMSAVARTVATTARGTIRTYADMTFAGELEACAAKRRALNNARCTEALELSKKVIGQVSGSSNESADAETRAHCRAQGGATSQTLVVRPEVAMEQGGRDRSDACGETRCGR